MRSSNVRHRGFTLMETVIAIGVVAVLLTGFMIVFGPAAQGIRKSISSQEADRLVSALEQELVNSRVGEEPSPGANPPLTGFDNALLRIKNSTGPIAGNADSGTADNALLVYQYRGSMATLRPDSSPAAISTESPGTPVSELRAGQDYVLVPMMRRRSSLLLPQDLKDIEGALFLVKCVQMVYDDQGALVALDNPERGKIVDPNQGASREGIADPPGGVYPEAVIAFRAEFYQLPAKNAGFIEGQAFEDFFSRATRPTFVRNLAIRR